MRIDTHAHVYDGGWPLGSPLGLSAGKMLEVMDKYDVSNVWISSLTGLVREFREYNYRLHKFTKVNPKKLIGFFTINPYYGEFIEDEIKRCVEVYGFKGIKLHSWLQGFSLTYDVVNKIIETSIKYDLPIQFHDGTPPYADTLQVANLAELYPEAKIILGHAGLYDSYRSAVSAAKRLPNIFLCLNGPAISDIKYILKEVDINKILWGSDFGSLWVNDLIERIKILELSVDNGEQKEKIFFKNANSLIKI